MASYHIAGGTPLYGSVRLGGAKNASYKLMIASLMGSGESRLLNFSKISDVASVGEIITHLGGRIQTRGERTLFIDPKGITKFQIPQKFGPISRSAPMFLPILLHRFGQAIVPHPGGDKIGSRPLDRHFDGLSKMGARVEPTGQYIKVTASSLEGTVYRFAKNTHTGTELMIMAGVLAKGKTVLENAALEPEIDDLIEMLSDMGANLRRRQGRVIEIEGVKTLKPTIHRIMPDRNEAVSYACAAIATKGDIVVENAISAHLEAFLDKLAEMGAGYEIGKYGIRFFHQGPLRPVDVETQPHPGFMTDWQPIWAVLLTQTTGVSVIHETIYPSRFQYIGHLESMGVKVELFNPSVSDPAKFYNFDPQSEIPGSFHAVKITGGNRLQPGDFTVKDLRHGATMTLAAIIAHGNSIIRRVEEIDRGYEELDSRLVSMGAKIKRVND